MTSLDYKRFAIWGIAINIALWTNINVLSAHPDWVIKDYIYIALATACTAFLLAVALVAIESVFDWWCTKRR